MKAMPLSTYRSLNSVLFHCLWPKWRVQQKASTQYDMTWSWFSSLVQNKSKYPWVEREAGQGDFRSVLGNTENHHYRLRPELSPWKALLISRDATSAFLQHLSRKLLAYDPPPQPPGKAGSWAFGIISYFINGLSSYSWGQLEGLLDLIMLESEAARNNSHGAREKQPGESKQAKRRFDEMWVMLLRMRG